jgi:hypothetical protein
MNVKQVQKLVTEQYQEKKMLGLQNQYKEYHSLLFDNSNNSDCSIVGQGSPVYFFNRLGIDIILYLQKNTRFRGSLFFEIVRNQHLRKNCYVELGHYARVSDNGIYAPYNGYLNTVGSNGNQSWNGPLYGMIVNFILSAWYMSETYFIGIKNFKGFSISRNESKYFFGTASYVEIHLGQFPNSPY